MPPDPLGHTSYIHCIADSWRYVLVQRVNQMSRRFGNVEAAHIDNHLLHQLPLRFQFPSKPTFSRVY